MGRTTFAGRGSDRLLIWSVVFALVVALVVFTATPARSADAPGEFDFALGSSSVVGGEAGGTHLVGVVLSGMGVGNDLDAAVTVNIDVVGGTATEGTDYTVSDGSLDFADTAIDGATESFALSITDDGLDEVNETIILELTVVTTGGSIEGTTIAQHTVTITDNDPLPALSVSDAPAVTEGGNSVFTVTLSPASGREVTVDYATVNGTAVAPGDFTADSDTLTFTAGVTSQQVIVATNNDDIDEAAQEQFTLVLSNPSNATISDDTGIGRINDNDSASLSVNDPVAVTEGSNITFTVTLSSPSSSTVTVDYDSVNGSAVAPGDFTAVSDTLTFTPGVTSQPVVVSTNDDDIDEVAQEQFTLVLSNPSNATISDGSGIGRINDNDSASLSVNDPAPVIEGGDITFTVTLSNPSSSTVTVDYATVNGTAVAPGDFAADSDTLTFAPGVTSQPVVVSTNNDDIDEAAQEQFTLVLSNPSNATISDASGTGRINDNDLPPEISISSDSAIEGEDLTFIVTLSNPSASTVTVDYDSVNGSAVAPGDFTAVSDTLTFTPGVTSRPVVVSTNQDVLPELPETLTVVLSGASNASIGAGTGTGTILDDDGAPGLAIFATAPAAEADGEIEFTISLVPAQGQEVTVTYATSNGTAIAPGDYTPVAPTIVTFDAGETEKIITVPLIDDGLDEVDETVTVTLSAPTPAPPEVEITVPSALGTIVDSNNVAPTIIESTLDTTNVLGTSQFQFETGQTVRFHGSFTDPGASDTHVVTIDWGDGSPATQVPVLGPPRDFEAAHVYTATGVFTITAEVQDGDGGVSDLGSRLVAVSQAAAAQNHVVGLVDTSQGRWFLYSNTGSRITDFYFGNPGDYPFLGDWDCDGVETPGLYRQSDGFVYLRDTNTAGPANIQFFFGNPGDVPIAGDFNGDGCDTVSIYRPANQTFYIINELGENNGGLGAAEFSYVFGNPGDKPFVGDFDGDGIETVGLHRESTGLVYFRNSHTQGNADAQFIYGDPDDRLIAGDWNGDGKYSPALFRPSNTTMYFRYTNTQGNADNQYVPVPVGSAWLPVAGDID